MLLAEAIELRDTAGYTLCSTDPGVEAVGSRSVPVC